MVGRFLLEQKGNYYLTDILEIALVAFHSFVTIHYSVPKRVQQLTGITNKTIKSVGLPFRGVMDGLIELLHRDQAQSVTIPIIIAHGGYLHDFPILLVRSMKHN